MTESMDKVLRLSNLCVSFDTEDGRVDAVRGVSYELKRGETIGVVGESGSGKSVTHMALLGLLPDSADIRADDLAVVDQDVLGMDERVMRKVRGKKIAMIFQDPMTALNPFLTLGTQIAEMHRLHGGLRGRALVNATVQSLREVGIPKPELRVEQYPHEFSGGMRQRAMIAMMLAANPEVLIADEPTTALDVTVQAQILELLAELQKSRGMSIVLITHDLGVVAGHAKRVFVMYAGRIVESGPTRELFQNPRHPYTRGLLDSLPRLDDEDRGLVPIPGQPPDLSALGEACPFAERCAHVEERCRQEEPELRDLGRPHAVAVDEAEPWASVRRLACHLDLPQHSVALEQSSQRARRMERAEPLLVVRDLAVQFPGKPGMPIRAVDGVDLELRAGETLGLVGESGCGKSTTARALLGLAPVHRGTATLAGDSLLGLSGKAQVRLRARMQMVFQDPYASLDPRMTVGKILAEPLAIHGLARGREKVLRTVELMLQVGLDPKFLNRYPHEFSGGQRQRIGIARALALDPDVLLLDEPVSALDVSIQAQVLNLLEELQHERGLAYLFIAHDLSVVRHLCDRVAVMYLGRIVEIGETKQLFQSPRHPYTRALLSAVPVPDPVIEAERQRILLEGDPPSPDREPIGCAFAGRCQRRSERCGVETPLLTAGATRVACFDPHE